MLESFIMRPLRVLMKLLRKKNQFGLLSCTIPFFCSGSLTELVMVIKLISCSQGHCYSDWTFAAVCKEVDVLKICVFVILYGFWAFFFFSQGIGKALEDTGRYVVVLELLYALLQQMWLCWWWRGRGIRRVLSMKAAWLCEQTRIPQDD